MRNNEKKITIEIGVAKKWPKSHKKSGLYVGAMKKLFNNAAF